MRIKHARIQNWRSCRDVSLSPGRITGLVGANDAGKTSILSALDFLMGSKWPTIQSLEDADFYGRSRKNGLKIQVWFEPEDDAPHTAWFEVAPEYAGTTGCRMQFKPESQTYSLNAKYRDRFPLIYIDADRSYERQFGMSRYTLFGQAIRKLEEHFSSQVGEDIKLQLGGHLDAAQSMLRTDLYDSFVMAVSAAFGEQLRHTEHKLNLDFRAFDPLRFYRSLQPLLTEGGEARTAGETGSGLRNLIVMALFRAYGKTFRGDGMVAIDEPEMYLHPHAQRGLMRLFREIAESGTQLFYTTHSSAFVDIEHFDDIVVVERCPDEVDGQICTSTRSLTADELLDRCRANRPGETIGIDGIRERYRHACGPEHTEALFGRVVVLVEGESEAASLPVYAETLGLNFDALGVSIVNARGKDSLESLYQVFRGLGFPVFVIFDNDVGKKSSGVDERERRQNSNRRLTRLIGLLESDAPPAQVAQTFAIMGKDFEATIQAEVDDLSLETFDEICAAAVSLYGTKSKPIKARHVAATLANYSFVPPTVEQILRRIVDLARRKSAMAHSDVVPDFSLDDLPW